MSHFQINLEAGRGWTNVDDVFVRGAAFVGDELKQGVTLAKHFENVTNPQEFVSLLKELNGFYTVVLKKNRMVIAAVDRVRSFPLFYGQHNEKFYISDDARWMREQVKDIEMDPLAREEFLLTGFVTGSDTLFPNVKQIQAGEVILFRTGENGEIIIESERYYRYMHSDYFSETGDMLLQKLGDVLQNVFGRLVTYANERTIVVPLSGGYDSRLIVLMLKYMRYKNVVAFSYGKTGNQEAEISQFVARELDIPWEFIPYSNKLWYEWYRSPEMKTYFKFADGLSSLPHIQDWPALWKLKNQNRIPLNSLFVPGISADLNTGGFIGKYPSIYSKEANKDELVELILEYSYSLFPFQSLPKNKQEAHHFKVSTLISSIPYCGSMGENFECWVSTEKVAKFVLNSVRVYEFFGYDWWTPYWDKDFVNFWYNVPQQHRISQTLYKAFIRKIVNELGIFGNIDPLFRDGSLPLKGISKKGTKVSVMNLCKSIPISIAKHVLPENIKTIVQRERNLLEFKNHPLQWYGIHDCSYVSRQIRAGATHINSILVIDYLNKLKNSPL